MYVITGSVTKARARRAAAAGTRERLLGPPGVILGDAMFCVEIIVWLGGEGM